MVLSVIEYREDRSPGRCVLALRTILVFNPLPQ